MRKSYNIKYKFMALFLTYAMLMTYFTGISMNVYAADPGSSFDTSKEGTADYTGVYASAFKAGAGAYFYSAADKANLGGFEKTDLVTLPDGASTANVPYGTTSFNTGGEQHTLYMKPHTQYLKLKCKVKFDWKPNQAWLALYASNCKWGDGTVDYIDPKYYYYITSSSTYYPLELNAFYQSHLQIQKSDLAASGTNTNYYSFSDSKYNGQWYEYEMMLEPNADDTLLNFKNQLDDWARADYPTPPYKSDAKKAMAEGARMYLTDVKVEAVQDVNFQLAKPADGGTVSYSYNGGTEQELSSNLSENIAYGTSVTLKATATEGSKWVFKGWKLGNSSNYVSTAATYTTQILNATSITPVFEDYSSDVDKYLFDKSDRNILKDTAFLWNATGGVVAGWQGSVSGATATTDGVANNNNMLTTTVNIPAGGATMYFAVHRHFDASKKFFMYVDDKAIPSRYGKEFGWENWKTDDPQYVSCKFTAGPHTISFQADTGITISNLGFSNTNCDITISESDLDNYFIYACSQDGMGDVTSLFKADADHTLSFPYGTAFRVLYKVKEIDSNKIFRYKITQPDGTTAVPVYYNRKKSISGTSDYIDYTKAEFGLYQNSVISKELVDREGAAGYLQKNPNESFNWITSGNGEYWQGATVNGENCYTHQPYQTKDDNDKWLYTKVTVEKGLYMLSYDWAYTLKTYATDSYKYPTLAFDVRNSAGQSVLPLSIADKYSDTMAQNPNTFMNQKYLLDLPAGTYTIRWDVTNILGKGYDDIYNTVFLKNFTFHKAKELNVGVQTYYYDKNGELQEFEDEAVKNSIGLTLSGAGTTAGSSKAAILNTVSAANVNATPEGYTFVKWFNEDLTDGGTSYMYSKRIMDENGATIKALYKRTSDIYVDETAKAIYAGGIPIIMYNNNAYYDLGTVGQYDVGIDDQLTLASALSGYKIYGSNKENTTTTNTNITVIGSTVGSVYGRNGSTPATSNEITGDTNILIDGSTVNGHIYGGSYKGTILGKTNIVVRNSSTVIGRIMGTYEYDTVSGDIGITLDNSKAGAIVGAGFTTVSGNIQISINKSTVNSYVCGTGTLEMSGASKVIVNDSSIDEIYSGNVGAPCLGSSEITVSGSETVIRTIHNASKANNANDYIFYGNSTITVNGGTINTIDGGKTVYGNSNIVISGKDTNVVTILLDRKEEAFRSDVPNPGNYTKGNTVLTISDEATVSYSASILYNLDGTTTSVDGKDKIILDSKNVKGAFASEVEARTFVGNIITMRKTAGIAKTPTLGGSLTGMEAIYAFEKTGVDDANCTQYTMKRLSTFTVAGMNVAANGNPVLIYGGKLYIDNGQIGVKDAADEEVLTSSNSTLGDLTNYSLYGGSIDGKSIASTNITILDTETMPKGIYGGSRVVKGQASNVDKTYIGIKGNCSPQSDTFIYGGNYSADGVLTDVVTNSVIEAGTAGGEEIVLKNIGIDGGGDYYSKTENASVTANKIKMEYSGTTAGIGNIKTSKGTVNNSTITVDSSTSIKIEGNKRSADMPGTSKVNVTNSTVGSINAVSGGKFSDVEIKLDNATVTGEVTANCDEIQNYNLTLSNTKVTGNITTNCAKIQNYNLNVSGKNTVINTLYTVNGTCTYGEVTLNIEDGNITKLYLANPSYFSYSTIVNRVSGDINASIKGTKVEELYCGSNRVQAVDGLTKLTLEGINIGTLYIGYKEDSQYEEGKDKADIYYNSGTINAIRTRKESSATDRYIPETTLYFNAPVENLTDKIIQKLPDGVQTLHIILTGNKKWFVPKIKTTSGDEIENDSQLYILPKAELDTGTCYTNGYPVIIREETAGDGSKKTNVYSDLGQIGVYEAGTDVLLVEGIPAETNIRGSYKTDYINYLAPIEESTITMMSGTVANIYGGSEFSSLSPAKININMLDGTVTKNIECTGAYDSGKAVNLSLLGGKVGNKVSIGYYDALKVVPGKVNLIMGDVNGFTDLSGCPEITKNRICVYADASSEMTLNFNNENTSAYRVSYVDAACKVTSNLNFEKASAYTSVFDPSNRIYSIQKDTTPPVVSNVSKGEATGSNIPVSFNSNKTGTYYILVKTAAETAPTAQSVVDNTMVTGQVTTTASAINANVNVDGGPGEYKAYIVVKDIVDNMSAVYDTEAFTITAATVKAHTVAVSASPAMGGTVSGGGTYDEGASITVTAAANNGYSFVNWTEGSVAVSTGASYSFALGNADRTLTANFAVNAAVTHTVAVSASPAAGGTVSGGGTYDEGASITVTAAVNTGYSFVNWTEGSVNVNTNASYTFTLGEADRTLTANFILMPPVVTTTGAITGTVKDGSGNPVAGANASLIVGSSDYIATTADDGTYTISNVPAGSGYNVTASKTGYNDGSTTASVTAGAISYNVDITITKKEVIPVTHNVKFVDWNGADLKIQTVNDGEGATAPANPSRSGYTFTGWDKAYDKVTSDLTVTAQYNLNVPTDGSGSGSGGSGSNTSTATTQTYQAIVSENGAASSTLLVSVDKKAGSAVIDLGSIQGDSIKGGRAKTITMPSIPDITDYTLGIPVSYLSRADANDTLTLNSDKGNITVPTNMLTGTDAEKGQKAQITIGQGDKSALPDEAKAAIGDRPLIKLMLAIDGNQTEWNNPNAPVTISIPYKPTVAELADPESIIIWYVDGSGNAVAIPNGHYNTATGLVTFSTTHFSYYAVGYNKVNFTDVQASAWYGKAISFIAARGITKGTGNGSYNPEARLTRSEFMVMMMKAYGIFSDANPADNFADAGSTYYTGYLAAAKRLGISGGIGSNMFAPEKEITRQEMFTLLYNALKVIGELPKGESGKQLSAFSDAGQVEAWAQDAMTLFVKAGVISGNGDKLSPASTTTRAEMAQILYNLLIK